jgi:anti-sigma factor RsiW
MLTCTSCQEQLLDYVYGLFDEADAESAKALTELRTHLASCTACQTALLRVQQQQGLIAEASHVPTTITFSKPAVEPRIARLRQRTTSVTTW